MKQKWKKKFIEEQIKNGKFEVVGDELDRGDVLGYSLLAQEHANEIARARTIAAVSPRGDQSTVNLFNKKTGRISVVLLTADSADLDFENGEEEGVSAKQVARDCAKLAAESIRENTAFFRDMNAKLKSGEIYDWEGLERACGDPQKLEQLLGIFSASKEKPTKLATLVGDEELLGVDAFAQEVKLACKFQMRAFPIGFSEELSGRTILHFRVLKGGEIPSGLATRLGSQGDFKAELRTTNNQQNLSAFLAHSLFREPITVELQPSFKLACGKWFAIATSFPEAKTSISSFPSIPDYFAKMG